MENEGATACPNCQRLQTQIDGLQAELAQLRQQVAALRKDSSTSSKPPSSDIVKPPKPAPPPGQDKRQRGGQPGHPRHQRAAFPPEQSLSRGQLAKVIAKVSAALAGPYDELLAALPGQASLNVDETGHKDQGQSMWTWCFRAELYTLFKIDPRRSADVLIEVLGREFDGVLGCDHFSAYRRYMRTCDVTVQFCLAHLIREVKFLTTLPELADVLYGTRLLMALEGLFGVIHRREQVPEGEFARQLQEARRRVLAAGTRDEGTPNSRRMAKRMARYGEAYFTFV